MSDRNATVVSLRAPATGPHAANRRPGVTPHIGVVTTPQNTFVIPPDGVITFSRPDSYAQPLFSCSLMNTGPGMVSARWDGQEAVFGSQDCILLPPMTGYAEAGTTLMSIAADGAGATVSVSCESNFG